MISYEMVKDDWPRFWDEFCSESTAPIDPTGKQIFLEKALDRFIARLIDLNNESPEPIEIAVLIGMSLSAITSTKTHNKKMIEKALEHMNPNHKTKISKILTFNLLQRLILGAIGLLIVVIQINQLMTHGVSYSSERWSINLVMGATLLVLALKKGEKP